MIYQEKILMYIGWHESQEKLKENKTFANNLEIIEKELYIKQKLVNVEDFKCQLESAKK